MLLQKDIYVILMFPVQSFWGNKPKYQTENIIPLIVPVFFLLLMILLVMLDNLYPEIFFIQNTFIISGGKTRKTFTWILLEFLA
jgi:hypothetical protein